MSPPPPTGITSASSSGASASISSATVPCPAITCGSSNGCTSTRPRSRRSWSARALASSKLSPASTTSAPSARVCSTFTVGVKRAALLERRGELEVLELQEHVAARELRERERVQARGALDRAPERVRRGAHVGERDLGHGARVYTGPRSVEAKGLGE